MTKAARDPVCGMMVDAERALSAPFQEETFFFCSEYCRNLFLSGPGPYAEAARSPLPVDDPARRRIAYFSMEVGIDPRLPIYSGGLGVLAGDTLRSLADLKVPAVGVTLLYAKGYFVQKLDAGGNQTEEPVEWKPSAVLSLLPPTVWITIGNRPVAVRAWQYDVKGSTGGALPLVLLDTNLEENTPYDRTLTAFLYGGDERYRLSQEIVLGIGGVRMLTALGYRGIERFT